MRRLVALDLPGGPDFVAALTRCIESDEAVAPIDHRLNGPARERVLRAVRPTDLIDRNGDRHRLSDGEMVDDTDAVVMTTSGTTGVPKGVILTHAAVLASAYATSARLEVARESDQWLSALPLSHIGGLSVALRAIVTGTPLTLLPRFDPEHYDQAIAAGATLTSLVPTTLARLGRSRSDRFRKILLGGSAVPIDLPSNVVTTYGMTETGSGVVYDGIPLEGVEIAIRDGGEIALRCPMLLRCYRDGTDPRDPEGYLSTGDVGAIDERGRLQVFGRGDELIISGGENIWPVALEQALMGAPGVVEIAVTGVRDPEWGQRVIGIVVSAGDREPSLETLNERCRSQIGPWAVLKELFVVDALPRTPVGKIDRAGLARLVANAI